VLKVIHRSWPVTAYVCSAMCAIVGCIAVGDTTLARAAAPQPAAAALPDARLYEMVTPAENQGADLYVPYVVSEVTLKNGYAGIHTRLPFEASANGNAVAYVGDASVGGTGSTGLGLGDEYLAKRAYQGNWTQATLQPPFLASAYYQAFSRDLSVGVLQSGEGYSGFEEPRISEVGAPGSLTEAPEVPRGGYRFLYAHSGPNGNGIYYPLVATKPPNRTPSEFGSVGVPRIYDGASAVFAFAGASASFGELLFEANDVLAAGAVDGGAEANNLYASVGGVPRLVNVLPDGGSEAGATFGSPGVIRAGNPPDFSHVVSADGSRVFWTDLNTGVLYASEGVGSPGERAVELDASEGVGGSGGGRFWTASEDGSRVFFTDESQLTPDSTAGPEVPDLYEYDFGKPVGERLTDLSVDGSPGGHADVQGVIGVSEEEASAEEHDGGFVYFVAQGVLASNSNAQGVSAETGQDNLYVFRQRSGIKFIAQLSEADDKSALGRALDRQNPTSEFGDWQPGLGHRTAEVTPNGGGLVFMSNDQAVDGYSPEVNGEKLEEVYVYDYASDSLACASCDPRHEPTPATYIATEEGKGGFLPPSWSNTFLPGWLSSDGGRVVFDSSEPLVAGDVNGEPDVYEWERDGEGSCGLAAGCVFLLSGGTSESGSWLAAESASGDDVFIVTRSQLVPDDQNEAFDLYDARVGGVQPVVPAGECVGVGCVSPPAAQPVFGSPASASFEGVGNFPPPTKVTTKPKPKPKKTKKAGKSKKKKKKSTVKAKVKSRVRGRSGSLVGGLGR
jgi:hypothetical protein